MAETFTLHFPDIVRVAGEIVQGHVELNLRKALDEKVENVRIKLRGSIVTYVLLSRAHSKSQYHSFSAGKSPRPNMNMVQMAPKTKPTTRPRPFK
jgi:hypothetical protein